MDYNMLLTMITTVGFPIVMTGGVCWFVVYLMKFIERQNDRHDIESQKFTEALNNNTLVLQKLCTKLNEKGDM